MFEFVCRLHCKSSVAAFSCHLVPCTSWIFARYELCLKPTVSRGCVSALMGEYVPSFSPRVFFRVFVSGGYTSNQCQPIRHTQGLRHVHPVKPIGFLGFFIFSMIWAAFTLAFSAFLVVARLRTWGLVVLVLCLTSAQIVRLSLAARSTCLKSMSNWQFWTGQSFVVAWRSLLITFHPSLARSRRIIVYLKSSQTDIARESQSHYSSQIVPPLCAVAAMQEHFP